MTKQSYEAPVLEKLGSFEAMTQSITGGTITDANFNADDGILLNATS